MRIIYWSDFNCPNSYIGLVRLKKAVDELDLDAKWEMKPFELYPTLFNAPTSSIITQNVLKYGLTPEETEKKIIETEKIALKDGIELNYKDIQLTSSRNAHRLVKYVQNRHPDISQELIFKIFEANFCKNRIIADITTLVEISSELGLDESEIRNVLEGDSYNFEVQIEEYGKAEQTNNLIYVLIDLGHPRKVKKVQELHDMRFNNGENPPLLFVIDSTKKESASIA